MITNFIPDTKPSTLTGFLTKVVVTCIDNTPPKTIATCEQSECCDKLLALAGGSEEWENDKAAFLFKLPYMNGSGQSLNMFLMKDDEDVVQLDELVDFGDLALGTYFPLETWTAVQGQELYSGFLLNWSAVLALYGHGSYSVRAEKYIGESLVDTEYSECYELFEYNCNLADGTVYFEWLQNGEIKSGIDYTDMNWWQYRRVKGKFGSWRPTLEKDSVLYVTYKEKQIQDKIVNKYSYQSELMKEIETKKIVFDMMLADEILVTDYNIFNHRKDYVQFEVRQDEIGDMTEFAFSNKAVLTLSFTDRTKNFIKNS